MPHSYEELRSVAIDVLAGREQMLFGNNTQYEHLSLSIGHVMARREGRIQPGHQGGTYPLDESDREILLELFWDLFRQGIITLGMNDANREFPFFRVTSRGRQMLSDQGGYFFHDVSSYEAAIRSAVPNINDVTVVYLKESMQAFRSGCMLSSTVMLGVAAEHTFNLLLDVIEGGSQRTRFSAAMSERSILNRFNRFQEALTPLLPSLPYAIREDFDTHCAGILSVIRTFRNEAGHPTGKIMDREQTFVLLQLSIPYVRKQYQLMDCLR